MLRACALCLCCGACMHSLGLLLAPKRTHMTPAASDKTWSPSRPSLASPGDGAGAGMAFIAAANVPRAEACGWAHLLQAAGGTAGCGGTALYPGPTSASSGEPLEVPAAQQEGQEDRMRRLRAALADADVKGAAAALLEGLAAGRGGLRLMSLAEVAGYEQLLLLLQAVQHVSEGGR